jgi:hypothetical protein
MVDNPTQDFRLVTASPQADDVYEIDHALEIDPTSCFVNPNFV